MALTKMEGTTPTWGVEGYKSFLVVQPNIHGDLLKVTSAGRYLEKTRMNENKIFLGTNLTLGASWTNVCLSVNKTVHMTCRVTILDFYKSNTHYRSY